MSDLNAYWFLQRAHDHLDNANAELNRPARDIVTFSVCHQSKGIMTDFFRSFLLLHGVNLPAATDLEALRLRCAEIDSRFSTLDLSCMSCHPAKTEHTTAYCTDLDKVKNCIHIADEVKALVDESFRRKEERKDL